MLTFLWISSLLSISDFEYFLRRLNNLDLKKKNIPLGVGSILYYTIHYNISMSIFFFIPQ